jgi:hypothetical protein
MPEVEVGINRIISYFKAFQLYVFDTCEGLRSELGSYSRKLNPETNNPMDEIENKEDYHRLDALRYASQGMLASATTGEAPVRRYVGGRK